jgi:hypothetical protein
MKTQKPKNIKFTAPKYDELFAAVTQHGGELHKGFWDMMIEAGFTKKQITHRYTQMLLGINSVNSKILGAANFKS